jgi:F0F1-type ATP synthase membrane subunit b/b'
VDLALSAAEKVIGENMNSDRNRKLVEDFINKVEVTK